MIGRQTQVSYEPNLGLVHRLRSLDLSNRTVWWSSQQSWSD